MIVNGLQATMAPSRAARRTATVAAVACLAAIGALIVELARDDPRGLAILAGIASGIALARYAFVRTSQEPG